MPRAASGRNGQGFYAYPQPDADQPGEGIVKLQTIHLGAGAIASADGAGADADGGVTVAIAWLANGQMNAIAPAVIEDLGKVWAHVKAADPPVRALVIASSNPFLYSAGADIKAFTQLDEAGGRKLVDDAHRLFSELGSEGVATIAAVNGLAFGGGCELAMACDLRIVARSAVFGQPEIKLGIIPGFGGTQRLPRLVGQSKALEMNLIGDPMLADEAYEYGLASAVVDDHELLDTALAWARKLAGQAPLALEQIKQVSAKGDLDEGIAAEKAGFATVFQSADGREGIAAFLGKRAPRFEGK